MFNALASWLGLILIAMLAVASAYAVRFWRRKEQAKFDRDMAAERSTQRHQAREKLVDQLRQLLLRLANGTASAVDPGPALQHTTALLVQVHFELEQDIFDRAGPLLHSAEEHARQAGLTADPESAEPASGPFAVSQILGNSPVLWWIGYLLVRYGLAGPIAPPQDLSNS